MCCSIAFIWMISLKELIHRLDRLNHHLVPFNNQQHRKLLLKSPHLNCSSHFRISYTDSTFIKNHLVQHNQQDFNNALLSNFHLNGQRGLKISSTDSSIERSILVYVFVNSSSILWVNTKINLFLVKNCLSSPKTRITDLLGWRATLY